VKSRKPKTFGAVSGAGVWAAEERTREQSVRKVTNERWRKRCSCQRMKVRQTAYTRGRT
jgi:hypothetical protein